MSLNLTIAYICGRIIIFICALHLLIDIVKSWPHLLAPFVNHRFIAIFVVSLLVIGSALFLATTEKLVFISAHLCDDPTF